MEKNPIAKTQKVLYDLRLHENMNTDNVTTREGSENLLQKELETDSAKNLSTTTGL